MPAFLQALLQSTPLKLWFAAVVVFTAIELVARRPVPWPRRLVNLANGLVVIISIFFAGPVVAGVVAGLHHSFGITFNPPFMLDFYIQSPPLAALVFLFLYDFGYYWFHRLEHANPLLWRIHAVHHSETALNTTSYLRQHFLENVLQSFVILVPLLMLVSLLPATFAWVALISTVFQFFAHADLPVHFGPLSHLIVSPRLHRLHHSIYTAESETNFASLFPFWDLVFGTYMHPSAHHPPTGLRSGRTLDGFLPLLVSPFHSQPTEGTANVR